MATNDYVYLKNVNGQIIKPVTDLSAINMTTTNGIAVDASNGGTIGIRSGYIENCVVTELSQPDQQATPESAYIDGGTMFQLIGGYAVTDEIPPITGASHEKIPSEYSVRSAIDALATLGPSLAPGAGIVVETVPGGTGGTIAVAPGNGINVATAQQGGVSVKAGTGITVDATGVNVNTATNNTFGGIAGATNGVQLVGGVAQFDNATVDAATPAEITGGTAKIVQADDLHTALHLDWDTIPMEQMAFNNINCDKEFIGSTTNVHGEITGGTVHCSNFLGSSAANAGIQWANLGYSMPKLNKAGKYLVTVEVYNNLTGANDRVSMVGHFGVSYPSGIPYYTLAHNEWVKLGILVTSTGDISESEYITFYTANTSTSVDFYMRNLAIMDVTDIPASDYVTVFNNSGYVYKPGDGIAFDADKIQIDNASTLDALNGVGTDGKPLYDRVLTPGNLKSALSIGQAVDCTSIPTRTASISITDDEGTAVNLADVYRDSFHAKLASWNGGWCYLGFGWDGSTNYYPKAANTADGTPLQYLMMADLENTGSSVVRVGFYVSLSNGTDQPHTPSMQYWNHYLQPGEKKRYSCMFWAKMDNGVSKTCAALSFYRPYGTGDLDVKISNLREFEVMALTDDAVMCLANIEDPDDANSLYLVKNDMVEPWINIIDMGSAPAVTLASGLAYKSTVITGSTCTFSTDTVPAGCYGQDAHLTLFVGSDSTVIFQPPLNLMDPLTPNSGHNITVKYRDGQALAYVDDTDIGYVVTVTSGTANGSLYYGLTTNLKANDTNYIVFSDTTDNQSVELEWIPVSGQTYMQPAYGFNIIGNGMDNTELVKEPGSANGYVRVASKKVVLQDFTTKIAFAFATDASTAAEITNVRFSGIDIADYRGNGNQCRALQLGYGTMRNCIIENCFKSVESASYWGVISVNSGTLQNCVFKNSPTLRPLYLATSGGTVSISGCTFYGVGDSTDVADVFGYYPVTVTMEDCVFTHHGYNFNNNLNYMVDGNLYLKGTNVFDRIVTTYSTTTVGSSITISPNAVIDLSGNTNTKAITMRAAGDKITVVSGDTAYVYPYGSTVGVDAPVAITGTGNTLLNTGKLGFLVGVASGTAANTLYDALVGGGTAYSNVIFNPTLNGQAVSMPDGTSFRDGDRYIYIIGNGVDNTILSGYMKTSNGSMYNSSNSKRCLFQDLTISGATSDACFANYKNCKITNITVRPSYFAQASNFEDCLITGITYTGYQNVFAWISSLRSDMTGTKNCTVTDNSMYAIFGSFYATTDNFDNCIFTGNTNLSSATSESDGACIVYSEKRVSSLDAGTVSNCYFNNPDWVGKGGAVQAIDATTVGTVGLMLSGNTFYSPADSVRAGADYQIIFAGTNILNSTVSGAGTVVFTDGATVTSIVPEGSTIGTGVLGSTMSTPVDTSMLIENCTVTAGNSIRQNTNVVYKNCAFSTTVDTYFTGGNWGRPSILFDSCSQTAVYGRMLSMAQTSCRIKDCSFTGGSATQFGARDGYFFVQGTSTVHTIRSFSNGTVDIWLEDGSTVTINGSLDARYGTDTTGSLKVGVLSDDTPTYDASATATVITGGTTYVVGGTGTYFDSTRTPVTDLTIISAT